jgi:hypothetical protein
MAKEEEEGRSERNGRRKMDDGALSLSLSLFPRGGGDTLLSRVRRSLSLASLSLSLPAEAVFTRVFDDVLARTTVDGSTGTVAAFPLADERDRQQQKGAVQEE